MHDVFAATFPAVRGPWAIVLRNADIAKTTFDMYERLCPGTKLGQDRLELMILTVARRYTTPYIWFIHERLAREYGIEQPVIDAIRQRTAPPFANDGDRLVAEVTAALLESWNLDDATYARALDALGEERLVELVTSVGFYAMLALQLNTFAAAVPAGVAPLV